MRVFIIDDSVVARRMLGRILTSDKDIEIVGESDSGLACMLELSGIETDVIMLEAALGGGMTAADLVPQIRAIRPDARIVLCIDSLTKDMVVPFYDLGVVEFINKPYQRVRILSLMRRLKDELNSTNEITEQNETVEDLEAAEQIEPVDPSEPSEPIEEDEQDE